MLMPLDHQPDLEFHHMKETLHVNYDPKQQEIISIQLLCFLQETTDVPFPDENTPLDFLVYSSIFCHLFPNGVARAGANPSDTGKK